MRGKAKKIICIITLIIIFVSSINSVVKAVSPDGIIKDVTVSTEDMENTGKKIVSILQGIGVVLSVVILIIIGIKYMLGSVQEKAEYKKTLIPYIIGAALIFAASMFAQIAYDFFSNLG